MAWNPDTIKDATVLGPIKARPFGWPRKTRPALTGPVPAAARFGGRDGRMLAARVEPKNGRQKSKKTDNFKPLVLVQFQPAVDSGITVDIGDAIKPEIEGPVVEEPPAPEPGEILAALAVDGPEEVRRLWMFVRPVAN